MGRGFHSRRRRTAFAEASATQGASRSTPRDQASPRFTFTAAQTRAARGLMGWTVDRLAEAAGLSVDEVAAYEDGEDDLGSPERSAIARALYGDGAGVRPISEISGGEGVRFARPAMTRAGLDG